MYLKSNVIFPNLKLKLCSPMWRELTLCQSCNELKLTKLIKLIKTVIKKRHMEMQRQQLIISSSFFTIFGSEKVSG